MDHAQPNMKIFDNVKLDIFEGPLDLLLTLIREKDLDIYELSLSQVTEQYLEYVELLKEFDFDNIGDYMVIAAELGRIKSRSLLPEEDNEDPIDESDMNLIEMLRDYKKYRLLSENLNERVILGRDTFKRAFDNSFDPKVISGYPRIQTFSSSSGYDLFNSESNLIIITASLTLIPIFREISMFYISAYCTIPIHST